MSGALVASAVDEAVTRVRTTRAGKRIRFATPDDAAGIAALDCAPQVAAMVMPWPAEKHRRAMASPDFCYLIADDFSSVGDRREPRGFAILGGLQTPHRAIEIVRIIVAGRRFGLGADLMDACVRYAFGELGAHRIWSDTFSDNHAVRRMASHYGFTEEGVLRDAIVFDGRYRSVVIMGLLADEAARIIGPA
jgi:RimJ/RimL family protein N-acetyltransferase